MPKHFVTGLKLGDVFADGLDPARKVGSYGRALGIAQPSSEQSGEQRPGHP